MQQTSLSREIPRVALLIETAIGPGREILSGVIRYMRERGRWSVFHQARNLTDPFPTWLESWDGDGIIARIQDQRMAEMVTAAGIPAVDVLGVVPHPEVPLVHVDDRAIARLAAEHLLGRGFRHFGFFGVAKENWSELRCNEFRRVVQEAGCNCEVFEVSRIQLTETPWDTQEDELARWVGKVPKPAGLMACTDTCGPMLLEACRRRGIKVPDEAAVVGVNNDTTICELCDPPLSSVNCNLPQVGYEAAALLARLMAGRRAPRRAKPVPPVGVTTRLSSDVVAVDDRAVRAAVQFIRERAGKDIDVDAVVRHASMSRSVLQRRFRQLLGRSIHDQIVHYRVQRAVELLSETNLSIAEIAEETGFNYQQYMGEIFQQELGETPAQLRRRIRVKSN